MFCICNKCFGPEDVETDLPIRAASEDKSIVPKFEQSVVQERNDGYWIETFKLSPKDKCPGLLV
jgi:hypothetical protein